MRPRAGEGWDPPPPGFQVEIGGRGALERRVVRDAWCPSPRRLTRTEGRPKNPSPVSADSIL
jgi:hypothetical protein